AARVAAAALAASAAMSGACERRIASLGRGLEDATDAGAGGAVVAGSGGDGNGTGGSSSGGSGGAPAPGTGGAAQPSGTIVELPVPGDAHPFGITAGADGNLWFTEFDAGKIARMTTAGAVTELDIPTPNSGPQG